MSCHPFAERHPDAWVLLPTISVEHATCECCDNGPVVIAISFLCFSIGIAIELHDHHA